MAGEAVMIVDDNEVNLDLAHYTLEVAGYTVSVARDADEVLQLLAGGYRPSIILMDIQLPGMSGLELTRIIKADPALAGIKIVALTSYAMRGDDEKALQAGCDGYITKPIETRTFAQAVGEFLQKQ